MDYFFYKIRNTLYLGIAVYLGIPYIAVFRVSSLLILYFMKVIFQDIRENIVKRCILYFVVLGSSLSTREPNSIKNCA